MSEKRAKHLRRRRGRPAPAQDTPMEAGDARPATHDNWTVPLQLLVPLKVLALYERGGITWRDVFLAYLAGEVVGLEADSSHSAAGAARAGGRGLNRAARALAVLSYLPGGVGEGWVPFDAASYLAPLIGAEAARVHVDAAVRSALAIPASREPLSELARRFSTGAGDPPQPVAYLTLEGEPPQPTALARALIAFLASDHFLSAWRRSPRQAQVPREEMVRGFLLSAAGTRATGADGELAAAFGDTRRWIAYYLRCHRQLEAIRVQQPGRIGVLYSFARSGNRMERALLQHLALLIASDQYFVLEDELPEDQDYQDLVETLRTLLT